MNKGKKAAVEDTPMQDESIPRPLKTSHEIYSSLVKVPRVELFDWKHPVEVRLHGKPPETRYEPITNIQGIYINPKWRQSEVGDRLVFNDDRKPTSQAHQKYARRKGGEVYRLDESDSSDDAARKLEEQRQKNYLTISDFTKLTIPKSVMKDGMIFIWVEKEFISAIIKHLESQGF